MKKNIIGAAVMGSMLTFVGLGCSPPRNNAPTGMPSGVHWVGSDCRGLTQLQCYAWYEVQK